MSVRLSNRRQPGKLHLETWADNKHVLVTIFAMEAALSADACYEACRAARTMADYKGLIQYPPLPQWLSLYDDPHAMTEEVLKTLSPQCVGSSLLKLSDEAAPQGRKITEVLEEAENGVLTQEQFQVWLARGRLLAQELWREHVERLRETLAEMKEEDRATPLTEKDHAPASTQEATRLLQSSRTLFFLRVWMPCWMEYGRSPKDLLAEARTGDIDAIEKLLRLDKGAILEDAAIRQHYHTAQTQKNQGWLDRFHRGQTGEPLGRFSSQRIKYCLAALIFKIAAGLDHDFKKIWRKMGLRFPRGKRLQVKLSYGDIRALFDAVAKDRGRERDGDLPDEPHSFYVRVKEYSAFWGDVKNLTKFFPLS